MDWAFGTMDAYVAGGMADGYRKTGGAVKQTYKRRTDKSGKFLKAKSS